MVRSLMALVLRRVLAWLVWSDEHAKDLEIVVLRHQLQVLRRQAGRPRIRWSDRLFLAAASRHLPRETWRTFLVTPQTVLRWHRELVRRKWSRGAGRRPGRPSLAEATRALTLRWLAKTRGGDISGFKGSWRSSAFECRPPRSGYSWAATGSDRPRAGVESAGGCSSVSRPRASSRVTSLQSRRWG